MEMIQESGKVWVFGFFSLIFVKLVNTFLFLNYQRDVLAEEDWDIYTTSVFSVESCWRIIMLWNGFPMFSCQNMEERPAGGGHDRESGGAGSPAGQGEAGVSRWVRLSSDLLQAELLLASHLNCPLRLSRQTDGGDRGAQSTEGPEGGGTLLLPVGVFLKQKRVARIHDFRSKFTSVIKVF